jgi:hypothetical protein
MKLERASKKYRLHDLGYKRNWFQVWGKDWRFWFLPVELGKNWRSKYGRRKRRGNDGEIVGEDELDGYSWPINEENFNKLQEINKRVRLVKH